MSANYVCIRYGGIRDHAQAGGISQHGLRAGNHDLKHCDPHRRGLVMAMGPKADAIGSVLDSFDVGPCLDAATMAAGATQRKGTSVGAQFLFFATDAYFEHEGRHPTSDTVDDASYPFPELDCDALKSELATLLRRKGWHATFLPQPSNEADGDEREKATARRLETGLLRDRWRSAYEAGSEQTRKWLTRFDLDRVLAWMATIVLAIESSARVSPREPAPRPR